VLEYAFVLKPLSDLAPDFRHPLTGKTFGEHWQAFDRRSQPLTPCNAGVCIPHTNPNPAG
jgi:2-amino-4-hydroxy-6-hydroxymethyldihydropteridine diphosphokinase